MKNWTFIAKASGVKIPAEDLDRVTKPLDGLEAAFRPLVKELTWGMEPAAGFQAEEGGE